MPTMTSRRSLAAIVLCALCTCANLVPLGSGDWRLGPQGQDGRALDGVEERDAYIRALAVFFRRLSVSQVFHREIWEKEPRHWTPAETGIPRPHFGYANITTAAAAGMLGNSGDTYFTEQQGGHLCAGARDANGTVRRAGFFKINHRLALSGVQMTNAVLEEQFRSGATLSINKAGYVWDWIADICRAAMGALGMYTNVNLYATREGAAVAIPAHNDRQDVFILQLQGHKRWVLFKPVEPLPTYEQERGKDHGGPMAMEELSAEHKTHDLVLSPGDVLYVPRGYVHETSTVSDKYLDAHPSEARDTHSIALTLGIETATLSQTFENLLTCLAAKAQWHPAVGLDQAGQAVAAVRAATAKAVELRRALPLGFLARYTSRRKTIATARALVSTYVAQDFADFDARLRLRKSDYAKVWAYFEAEAHAHFNRSLSVYAGVKGAEAGKATERQRQADARFLEHSRNLLKPCGISLDDVPDLQIKSKQVKATTSRTYY